MPVHLVPTPIHQDLRTAAQDMLSGVESGLIVGLGVVVLLRGSRFFVDALGTMARDPHAGRGYVRSLDDCLRAIGERRRDTNTTL